MIAPHDKKICLAGLGPPAGARNRRKATVTKRRKTAPGFNTPDPLFSVQLHLQSFTYTIIPISSPYGGPTLTLFLTLRDKSEPLLDLT